MNTSLKGRIKELQCLKEIILYYQHQHYIVLKSWHTHRNRAGGNDYLDSWDIALLIKKNGITEEVGIQVKSKFSWTEFNRLNKLWIEISGNFFFAIYNQQISKEANICLPHFQLFSVNGYSPLLFKINKK